MKAVIPVAGAGTMLRPHTHTQPKALVPVAGKPLLSHIIDSLANGGISHFVLIIGHMGNKIKGYVESHYKNQGLTFDFVVQEPREGSAHAVLIAKDCIGDDNEFLVMFGDTIINCHLPDFINSEHSVVGIKKVERPGDFGIAEIGADGFVRKFIEKPRIPKSNLGMVGVYKIHNASVLFQSIKEMMEIDKLPTEEYSLTDALMRTINKGEKVITAEVDGWYDCGKKETLLEANSILLNRPNFPLSDYTEDAETVIIQPVKIGKNCKIRHSIIGPNVVIGDNAIIENAIVRNSIVGSYSELQNVILDQSIMGNDTYLKGLSQSLNIGDNTEIILG